MVQQDDDADEDRNRLGGIGADGYRGVDSTPVTLPMTNASAFEDGAVHRVDANAAAYETTQSPFSGEHLNIRKPAVAYLIAAAAVEPNTFTRQHSAL